jgi:hypothetical protein
MPTYVPGYEHDIFVSYAHVDNQPFADNQAGWVTTLINHLKNLLSKKLGRADAYSLWMDYRLTGNEPVTPDIDNQLKNTAIFLPILSTGYLTSPWCLLEFNTFLKQVGPSSGRIFMVEHHFITRDEKPLEFQELLGYPFWLNTATGGTRTLGIPTPHPETEPAYYQQLDTLAEQLTEKIKVLRAATTTENPANKPSSPVNERLIKARIEAEKAILNTKLADLEQQHSAIASQLRTTSDPANKAILKNKLIEIEGEFATLTDQLQQLDR